MSRPAATAALVLAFVGLYWAGGWLGNRLVVGEDAVVLLWPPGALGFVLLLRRGAGTWWWIALADAVFGLTGSGSPASFVPFSVLANVIGSVAAAAVARRLRLDQRGLPLSALRGVLLAGLALAAASLPFGLAGLLVSGITPLTAWDAAALKWIVANVFGLFVLAPALLLMWEPPGTAARGDPSPSRLPERALWLSALALALLLVALTDARSVSNAAAMLALPSVVLLWGAARMPGRLAATGSLVAGVVLTLMAAQDVGVLEEPRSPAESMLLLVLLFTLTLAPLLLLAAIEDARRVARETLARARTDALTGLANRDGLAVQVEALLRRSSPGRPMLLVLVDIDSFTLINDGGGLAAGDAFLRGVANALRTLLPEEGVLGRLAADQFVLVLPDLAPAAADERAQEARRVVRGYRHGQGEQLFSATASVGAVSFIAGGADWDRLLTLADAACATAKENGGNRVQLTDAAEGNEAVEARRSTMQWAVRLERALREDGFRLHAQSILPLGAGHGEGRHFEVLVRMVDPDTGDLLPPSRFVPAAERFKLGAQLDRHVIDRTLAWLEASPHALAQTDLCAINLCAASVTDAEFLGFLRERVARSSVPASKLCLEITETSAVRDLDDAQQFIALARGLGLRLALDDFGAGFCSFAYLRRLDVDFFKIDGSFVRDIESSPLSVSIVRSIAEIARSTGKQTIAEFVETPGIRLRLGQLGVDFAQGFGIDHPQPIEQYFRRPLATPR